MHAHSRAEPLDDQENVDAEPMFPAHGNNVLLHASSLRVALDQLYLNQCAWSHVYCIDPLSCTDMHAVPDRTPSEQMLGTRV